ncbi:hypothetical protein PENTCL1PPCAC_7529, partial [Pristionchus entomophagus]
AMVAAFPLLLVVMESKTARTVETAKMRRIISKHAQNIPTSCRPSDATEDVFLPLLVVMVSKTARMDRMRGIAV